jgi:hypothetical protein
MKKITILVFFTLSLLFLAPSYSVFAADPMSDLLKQGDIEADIEAEYNKYPLSNYFFDFDDDFGIDVHIWIFMQVANLIWLLVMAFTRFSIIFIQQAFTLDLLNKPVQYLDELIDAINSVTWDVFASIFVAVAGLVAVFHLFVSYKRTKAFEQLWILVVVGAVSVLFFTRPADVLDTFNDVSKELSADVLVNMMPLYSDEGKDINDGVTALGNMLWRNHVTYPFYILEFGSYSLGEKYGEEMLSLPYGSDEREEFVEDLESKKDVWMLSDGIGQQLSRIFIGTIFLVYALLNLALMSVLSVVMLVYQLFPLVLMCLAGIVFLVSLWPGMGLRVIEKWLSRLVGAVFYKLMVSIILSIYLVLISLMYNMYGDNILLLILSMFICIFLIFMYRKQIIGMFTAIKDRDPQRAADAASQKMNFRERLSNKFDSVSQTAGRVLGAMYAAEKFGKLKKKMALKNLAPNAYEYLTYQYNRQKELAEREAHLKGTEPKYSDFVKSVDDNIERGLPLFSGQDLEKAKEYLYDVQKQGGNIDQIYLPTGVATTGMDDYAVAAMKYRDMQLKKRQRLEDNKNIHFAKASFAQSLLDKGLTVLPSTNKPLPKSKDVGLLTGKKQKFNLVKKPNNMFATATSLSARKATSDAARNRQAAYKLVKPSSMFTSVSPIVAKTAVKAVKMNLSPFSIPKVSEATLSGAKSFITSQWNSSKGSMTAPSFVSQYKKQSHEAFQKLHQLRLYKEFEDNGKISEFKSYFPKQYEEISTLKSFTGTDTSSLIKTAENNFVKAHANYKAAQDVTGFKSRKFIPGASGNVSVSSINVIENQILNKPSVPASPNIKVDDAFRQSIVNDYYKHEKLGMSQKDYMNKLNQKRREYYSNLKLFNEAAQKTTDEAQKKEFENMANKMRHLYVSSKLQYEEAAKIFGIELKRKNLKGKK